MTKVCGLLRIAFGPWAHHSFLNLIGTLLAGLDLFCGKVKLVFHAFVMKKCLFV